MNKTELLAMAISAKEKKSNRQSLYNRIAAKARVKKSNLADFPQATDTVFFGLNNEAIQVNPVSLKNIC